MRPGFSLGACCNAMFVHAPKASIDFESPDAAFGQEAPVMTGPTETLRGKQMLDRREWMKRAGMAALVTGLGSKRALALDTVTLPFDNGERPLVRYPQKRPMIGLTSRPPQLETPFSIYNAGPITPNNAFFVRYHLSDLPYNIDPDTFTLEIKGKVDKPLKLLLRDIR